MSAKKKNVKGPEKLTSAGFHPCFSSRPVIKQVKKDSAVGIMSAGQSPLFPVPEISISAKPILKMVSAGVHPCFANLPVQEPEKPAAGQMVSGYSPTLRLITEKAEKDAAEKLAAEQI